MRPIFHSTVASAPAAGAPRPLASIASVTRGLRASSPTPIFPSIFRVAILAVGPCRIKRPFVYYVTSIDVAPSGGCVKSLLRLASNFILD